MGIGVIVHGIIVCPGWGHQAEDQRVFHHNHKTIEQLPLSDPEWPFLTRGMFSMLPLRTSLELCIPQYESHVIHFAGSYKDMFSATHEWLTKFERLLNQLCWFSANATIWSLKYEWNVDIMGTAEQYRRDPPIPPGKWNFRCLELYEKPGEAPATDGKFKSDHHVTA